MPNFDVFLRFSSIEFIVLDHFFDVQYSNIENALPLLENYGNFDPTVILEHHPETAQALESSQIILSIFVLKSNFPTDRPMSLFSVRVAFCDEYCHRKHAD